MTTKPLSVEQYLWGELEKARIARAQVEDLPSDTPMLATIIALSNQGVISAASAWIKHVTR